MDSARLAARIERLRAAQPNSPEFDRAADDLLQGSVPTGTSRRLPGHTVGERLGRVVAQVRAELHELDPDQVAPRRLIGRELESSSRALQRYLFRLREHRLQLDEVVAELRAAGDDVLRHRTALRREVELTRIERDQVVAAAREAAVVANRVAGLAAAAQQSDHPERAAALQGLLPTCVAAVRDLQARVEVLDAHEAACAGLAARNRELARSLQAAADAVAAFLVAAHQVAAVRSSRLAGAQAQLITDQLGAQHRSARAALDDLPL